MPSFKGKVALVCGAARPPGIGTATAMRLAELGADIVCLDRSSGDDIGTDRAVPEQLAQLTSSIEAVGRQVLTLDADVSDFEAVDRAVSRALDRFGRIDVCCCLVGTAGPGAGSGDLVTLDAASWRRCVAINLDGPFYVARAVAAHMVERGGGGAITFLSSHSALTPAPTAGAIGVARAGINFLVRALAAELGPHGIRVNAACPLGVAPSPGAFPNTGLAGMVAASGGGSDPSEWAKNTIPLGRLQDAAETAALVVYLSSDDASFVSGQSIAVAGGA